MITLISIIRMSHLQLPCGSPGREVSGGSIRSANITATRNPSEMSHRKNENHPFSRRTLLKSLGLAPMLFCPAPFHASSFLFASREGLPGRPSDLSFADIRLTPHYPANSPLEDILRRVAPGSDEYVTEKYAFEIGSQLNKWGQALETSAQDLSVLAQS